MRILHINSYYQTGPFYKNLFDRQAALGDEIAVYTPVPVGFDPNSRDFGAYARVDANHSRFDRFFFPLKQYKMLRGALKYYSLTSFDAMHAHSLMTNGGIAYSLHKRFGVPYAVAVRDTDVNVMMKRMPWLRPLARRILAGASRVVFLSETYRDCALKPYLTSAQMADVLKKSAVIPNGIDAMWLQNPPAPRSNPNSDEIRLLFVGQLIARKNLPAAIRAAEALSARGRKVRLTVVGQPAE
jgi:glycosyltransferase involved in cell wall biosynthesis